MISRFPHFQTPPPPTPPPTDEPSDPNLTPLPTHPGIKYVARALAAILELRKMLIPFGAEQNMPAWELKNLGWPNFDRDSES